MVIAYLGSSICSGSPAMALWWQLKNIRIIYLSGSLKNAKKLLYKYCHNYQLIGNLWQVAGLLWQSLQKKDIVNKIHVNKIKDWQKEGDQKR